MYVWKASEIYFKIVVSGHEIVECSLEILNYGRRLEQKNIKKIKIGQ